MAKRKRKKSGGRWVTLLVVAVVVGGLLVGGTVAAVVAVRLLGGGVGVLGGPAAPLSAEMKYLPDGFISLYTRRMDQLLASPAYRQLRDAWTDVKLLETAPDTRGFPAADLERVTTANTLLGDVVVLTMKKPITGEQVLAANSNVRWTPENVNGYTVYTSKGLGVYIQGGPTNVDQGDGFCVPESRIVLFGTGAMLRPILQRNGPPKLNANVARGLQLVHLDRPLVAVRDCAGRDTWLDKENPLSLEVKPRTTTRDLLIKATETDVGQDVSTTLTYLCTDAGAAENLKQVIENATQKLASGREEARDLYKDEKVSVNGPMILIGLTAKPEAMLNWWRHRPFVGFGE